MRLSSVDTHLVVALHALLLERSVTRAARRLGVTQPTMSHALARLRACFDDPLFVIRGRAMVPTARALALEDSVVGAIDALERVFQPERPFDARRDARTFHVAATDNLELIVLPRLARLLAEEAPRVDVRCRALNSEWEEALRRGDLDLKLGRFGPRSKGIVREVLAKERLVCVVRKGHPALDAKLTAKRYAAFDHLLIAPHGGDTSPIDRALEGLGLRRRIAMTVSHFLVAPFVVVESDLVLTAPSRVAAEIAPSLPLVVLECPVATAGYPLELAWAERARHDPALAWLRAVIRRVVDEGALSAKDVRRREREHERRDR